MPDSIAGAGKLAVDETKIWLLRRKEDGKLYRIYHDGREELEPDDPETKEK